MSRCKSHWHAWHAGCRHLRALGLTSRSGFKRERPKSNCFSRVIIVMTSAHDSNLGEKREFSKISNFPNLLESCISSSTFCLGSLPRNLSPSPSSLPWNDWRWRKRIDGSVLYQDSHRFWPYRFSTARRRLMNLWRGMASDFCQTSRWSGATPRLTIYWPLR